MKRIVFLFLLLLCRFSVQAQKDLDGFYMGIPAYKEIPGLFSREDYIIISGDKLTYLIPQYHCPIRYNDTLAECTFQWIDKEFIELNNIGSPLETVAAQTSVSEMYDSHIAKDSLAIQFYIKDFGPGIFINVYKDEIITPYVMKYTHDYDTLMLPIDTENFYFDIAITDTDALDDYLCYRLRRYESPVYNRNRDINFIKIEMSLADLIEKFYVNHEYARIKGRKIIWHGRTFRKVSFRRMRTLWRVYYHDFK